MTPKSDSIINRMTTTPQPARYISLEEGTPEYEIAKNWLRWAGRDGTTHVYTDAGIESVWVEYIARIEKGE